MRHQAKEVGTSWTVLVGPDRTVLVDGFHLDPNEVLGRVFHHARAHPPKETHA